MDIVRRVAGEHPRGSAVRIIDQVVNQGTGAARNTIVEKATGGISVYNGLRRCAYTGVH